MKKITPTKSTTVSAFCWTTAVLASILLGTVNAKANHLTNKDFYLTQYGTAGKWVILHGDGDSCAADTDNGRVQLRITYTEYTGDWLIGNPYYEHVESVQGGFSFGKVPHESLRFTTMEISSWAMYNFSSDNGFLSELRSGSHVVFDIDRGPQVFSLAGSSKALAMVEECARNLGKKPRRPAAQPVPRRNTVQPQPRRNTVQPQPRRQNNTPSKAVLSGTWHWSNAARNAQQNAIISTIKLTGNTTARYCYGFQCWDVNFQKHADNSVSFSTDGISKFFFNETGPNAIYGQYWETGNTRGQPTATVNMR